MTERKKYKKDPILEAVCIVGFKQASTERTFGLSYSDLSELYPNAELQPPDIVIRVGAGAPEPPKFIVLTSADGLNAVSIGNNQIGVHRLKPYTSWEQFLDQFPAVWKAMAPHLEPLNIGLRYINKFPIPPGAKIADYLNIRPNRLCCRFGTIVVCVFGV